MSDYLNALAAQYADPNRPGPCEECNRRPVPSRFLTGEWVDNHSGSCSQNSALRVCERCGHRHVDRDFGQVLACTMDVSLEEGRELQQRIVRRLEGEPQPTERAIGRSEATPGSEHTAASASANSPASGLGSTPEPGWRGSDVDEMGVTEGGRDS